MSLKDKQLSLTTGKKQNLGVKTTSIGESSLNALRHVTNDHHVQSSKANMYASVGSKILNNKTASLRKGEVA